jgi:ATP-dependent RNA helicase RhlE
VTPRPERGARTGRSRSGPRRPPARPAQATARNAELLAKFETITPDVAPRRFTDLLTVPELLMGVEDRRFAQTTPIQSAVFDTVAAGDDLVACAETGTGKTAAFLLPLMQHLLQSNREREGSARILVLAPTRELAVQIEDDVQGFGYHTAMRCAAVFGGVGMDGQEQALKAGVDIVVATPGRLMDHLRTGIAKFSGVEVLVLDEADRMLDMGFWPDVKFIVSQLPTDRPRQTLLFSATMPEEVMGFALEIMRAPKLVQLGVRNAPATSITHKAELLGRHEKIQWLSRFLRRAPGPTLVFSATKRGADRLARDLQSQGIRAAALHADRTQQDRLRAVEGFKSGTYKVLVATDIAARGLDIDAIETVVNYEVPFNRETYVHRVGRAGRAGSTGTAITLVSSDERSDMEEIADAFGLVLFEDAHAELVAAGDVVDGETPAAGSDAPKSEPTAEAGEAPRRRRAARPRRPRAGAAVDPSSGSEAVAAAEAPLTEPGEAAAGEPMPEGDETDTAPKKRRRRRRRKPGARAEDGTAAEDVADEGGAETPEPADGGPAAGGSESGS